MFKFSLTKNNNKIRKFYNPPKIIQKATLFRFKNIIHQQINVKE